MSQVIKYVNSKGREMLLTDGAAVRIRKKTAGLYDYEYSPDTTVLAQGVRVNRMVKDAKEYVITMDVTGTREERAEKLQKFYELADYDVATLQPGRLWVDDQYAEGYVIKSEMKYYDNRHRTLGREFTFYVPYPYWIEDRTLIFKKIEIEQNSGIDLPLDFSFDLGKAERGVDGIENRHYIPTSFLMTFYGPCVNPSVTIGGHLYKVNITLSSGEYLQIDSINKRVIRHTTTGEDVSEYNKREKSQSVFEPIQPGRQTLVWSGAFSFDLILHQERSELKWT